MPPVSTPPLATTIAPSETPYRFVEIVNFRSDFDASIRPGEVVNPKGIAYHQQLGKLILSLSPYAQSSDNDRTQILNLVAADGTRSRFAPSYTMFRRVESKLAVVPDAGPPVSAGFRPGDIFIGRGPRTQISRLGSNGAVISDIWADLQIGDGLWGGLCFDTEGGFGGRLIALEANGGIWLLNPDGSSVQLTNLAMRVEGITVSPATFGPLAKQIIVGVEGYGDQDANGGQVHAVGQNGTKTLLANIGFAAEHVIFIPPMGGTYYQAQLAFDRERENRLLQVSSSQFLSRAGRMIVINELSGELWEVAWDEAQKRYTQQIAGRAPGRWTTSGFQVQGTELEAGCFAIKIPRIPNWADWTVVPGGFSTDRAPAAGADALGDVLVFSKNQSNRQIYLNNLSRNRQLPDGVQALLPPDPDGTVREWGGWQRDPEPIVTPYSLTCTRHNNRLYAFAVRNDGNILQKYYLGDESDLAIQPWETIPGGLLSNSNVSSATVNGRLVVSALGQDQKLYFNELAPGGRSWSGWGQIPGGGATNLPPTVATFQDELYIFIRETGTGRVLVKTRTVDGDWTPWVATPGGGGTDLPVAAVTTEAGLFVFVTGFDSRPYVNMISDTGAWSGWHQLPNPGATDQALAPAAVGNRLFLFAKGIGDRQLYVRTTI